MENARECATTGICRQNRFDYRLIQRIGKPVGRLLVEKRAEAIIIVGKNKNKLLSAEVELGSLPQIRMQKALRQK